MTQTQVSAAPPSAAEIVDDRDDCLTIHALDLRLTQANLPYQPIAGKRLPSTKHFAVYADTITLTGGTLVNPGKDIRLCARQIRVEAPTALDVGGADAKTTFAPGEAATQENTTAGAAGKSGADATDGGDAGSIVIRAESVTAKGETAPAFSAVDLRTVVEQALRKAVTTYAAGVEAPVAVPAVPCVWDLMGQKAQISLDKGKLTGLRRVTVDAVPVDEGAGMLAVRLAFATVTLTGETRGLGTITMSFPVAMTARCFLPGGGRELALKAVEATVGEPRSARNDTTITTEGRAIVEKALRDAVADSITSIVEVARPALRPASLMLLAHGGRGGRGQDGHEGIQGSKGADGIETGEDTGTDFEGVISWPPRAVGKKGDTGGNAGSAGHSRNGGKGGTLVFDVVQPGPLAVACSVGAGLPGEPARAGARGRGGPGGAGKKCILYRMTRGSAVSQKVIEIAPDGADGDEGKDAEFKGAAGTAGTPGTFLRVNGAAYQAGATLPAFSYDLLAASQSMSQLLITQNTADLAFLNAKTDAESDYVITLYRWLIACNAVFAGTGAPASVGAEERAVRAALHTSAQTELMRLAQGLDYYGHSYDWVPVLTLKTLAKRCTELIALGSVIEQQYRTYVAKDSTIKEKLKALDGARKQIAQKQNEAQAELKRLDDEIDALFKQLKGYDDDLAAQRDTLNATEYKFKKEFFSYLVSKGETDFQQFLTMLGSVISCVGGVVIGVGEVAGAVKALNAVSGFMKEVKGVIKVLKKVQGGIKKLSEGYTSIKDYIGREEPNGAKLAVDSDELDKMLEDYLGEIPAADELREAMDYYVELAKTRNTAAYNYTGLVAQKLALKAQSGQLSAELPYLDAQAAAQQDNLLPVYTAYMQTAYQRLRRNLLKKLYEENRAYAYWSLRESPFEASNLTVADLATAHEGLIADIDAFREEGDAFERFTQVINVTAADYPAAFAALPKRRCLTFELDIRTTPGFRNMRHITAQAFELRFPDITATANVLNVSVVHNGLAMFNRLVDLQEAGSLRHFSHKPRAKFFKIDYGNRENTAGGTLGDDSQGYSGLSPFTTWKIDFTLSGNEWLDLSKIGRVEFKLSGRFQGPGTTMLRGRAARPPASA